jgi:hypothetical protein
MDPLTSMGIGLAGQLGGGILEDIGLTKKFNEMGGASSTIGDNMTGITQDMMGMSAAMMPQFMRQANYNAMGLSGDAARSDAAMYQDQAGRAYSGDIFQNARQMGTADQLRSLAFDDGARRTSSMAMENANRDLRNTAGLAGSGNPALLASLSRQAGQNQVQNANVMQSTTAQQAGQNLAQAAGIEGQAQQGLGRSRDQYYKQQIVPHLNQMQDISGIMGSAMNAGVSTAAQSMGQASNLVSNPLAALSTGLAGGGTDFLKNSLMKIFGTESDPQKDGQTAGVSPEGVWGFD